MRILQMMGGGDVGGAKTHIMTLVQALSAQNDRVPRQLPRRPVPQGSGGPRPERQGV